MDGDDVTGGTHPAGDTEKPPESGTGSQPVPHLLLTDRGAIFLAAGSVLGAWVGFRVPWPILLISVAMAVSARRPTGLFVVVVLVASSLSAHAAAGLTFESSEYRGEVTVVRDATVTRSGPQVEVRARGRHLLLIPRAGGVEAMANARAGDHLVVAGAQKPLEPGARYLRGMHIAGRLHATHVEIGRPPSWPWRVANAARDAVSDLAEPLPPQQQALFKGFVLGDASGQQAVEQADFQGAGLTHLLVASGENVAFLLILASPLLRRSGYRVRWAATVVLLVGFVLVTRFEPSVLRAAVMAAVAATGAGLGRPVSTWRSLALAVTVLILADPFLVRSVGFGLSVGASAGIIGIARPLAAALPGPKWVRVPLAVTIAAQLGVAPLLLVAFGAIPVATLPANVLAAPAAALVVVVGLPSLAVARLPLPFVAAAVSIPRALLAWIGGVARVFARLPLGASGGWVTSGCAVLVAGALFAASAGHDRLRRWSLIGAFVVIVLPVAMFALDPPGGDPVSGLSVVRAGPTVVIVLTGTVEPVSLLTGLSEMGVQRADVVVLPRGNAADLAALAVIEHRCVVRRVLVPDSARLPDDAPVDVTFETIKAGERHRYGDVVIDVVLDRPVLSVHAWASR